MTHPFFFSSQCSVCGSQHFFQVGTREVLEVSKIFTGKEKQFLLISAWILGGVWQFLQNWQKTGRIFTACQAGLKTCLISFQLTRPAPQEPADRWTESWEPETHLCSSSNLWAATSPLLEVWWGDCRTSVQPITGLFQARSSRLMDLPQPAGVFRISGSWATWSL